MKMNTVIRIGLLIFALLLIVGFIFRHIRGLILIGVLIAVGAFLLSGGFRSRVLAWWKQRH